MINPKDFHNTLIENGVNFFTGVPDSVLKPFCNYLCNTYQQNSTHDHVIAANEGNAIALAAGHYLATGKPGLVYMQNSGLGNAINPLTSLANDEVYGTPMLLLIGQRGGLEDACQHKKMSLSILKILSLLNIMARVLPDNYIYSEARWAVDTAKRKSCPAAIIVAPNTFEDCKLQTHPELIPQIQQLPSREDAIATILGQLNESDIVVASTGGISREVAAYRKQNDQSKTDFLNVGAMGHCSSIAMGVALSKPDRQVYCLDGDGSALMHLGAMATIGASQLTNFHHIILNNNCHDSVGGQPTTQTDFTDVAKGCGYYADQVTDIQGIKDEIQYTQWHKDQMGPTLLEILIKPGHRKDLQRPTDQPKTRKDKFMSEVVD